MKKQIESNELLELLLNAPQEVLLEQIEYIHPADILEIIHEEAVDVKTLFKRLPTTVVAAIIDEEDEEEKYELLKDLSEKKQRDIIDEMSSDELTDLVGAIEDDEAIEIFQKMSEENRADVKQLLTYDPETAGGIMATEFIAIYDNKTVKKTLQYLQEIAEDVENAYCLYVVDRQNHLRGVLSLRELVTSSFETPILDIANPNVIAVKYDMDQEEVVQRFDKYGFLAIPVIDYENHILGIITIDDVMQVMKDEATEDIHQLGGIAKEERVDGSVGESIKSRLPWLCVNLLTALLASAVVSLFEGTIAQVVALATVMPIITGMGGNVGNQTLTIIIRGMALGELTAKNTRKIFMKEIVAGLFNGVVIGTLVSVIGIVIGGKWIFGLIVGVAMIMNIIVAVLAGFGIPLLLKKFKIDPALASSIFVTTATDTLGFFFFLGLASVFIKQLI